MYSLLGVHWLVLRNPRLVYSKRLHTGSACVYALSCRVQTLVVVIFLPTSFIRAVRYSLNFAVFLLELALHFEVDLSFALDSLLLHIADHALMHCLGRGSA
jgi:hypothetical protein